MVSFSPEQLFTIGRFPVTNTVVHTLLIDAAIIGTTFYLSKRLSLIPKGFQNAVEALLETFYSLTESVAQTRAARIFPYFMTFFIFILLANWTGLLPGVGTIGFYHIEEHEKVLVPFLRSPGSDINTTLALALISAVATHMLSIKVVGIKDYVSRFFSLNPINLFIGILELISEITKVVSLSFRLFGNIFAGEVVLAKVSTIFAFLIPVPFLLLEVIVGFVQALVFGMLTMAFMSIMTTAHHEENHAHAKEVSRT